MSDFWHTNTEGLHLFIIHLFYFKNAPTTVSESVTRGGESADSSFNFQDLSLRVCMVKI